MSDDFDINDGSRPSLLDRGRALTQETEAPVDPEYSAQVQHASEGLEAFDWEILKKRAARLEQDQKAWSEPAPKRAWWKAMWLVPALAMAAAALIWVSPEPTTRAKGDVQLEFMVLDGDTIRPGVEGESLGAGDQIQFTYIAPGLDTLVLLSVDGEGTVTVFQPQVGDEPVAIVPGEKHVLDGSIILDDAPGPEVFVAVFGAADTFEAVLLARDAWEAGGTESVLDLERRDPAIATVHIQKD